MKALEVAEGKALEREEKFKEQVMMTTIMMRMTLMMMAMMTAMLTALENSRF